MIKNIRSDLAIENREKICGTSGSFSREEVCGGITINEITSDSGDKYVTIYADELWQIDGDERNIAIEIIADELKNTILQNSNKSISKDFSALIVGIGNEELTADAIGPSVVKNILVTKHLKSISAKLFYSLPYCSISAITPKVLGQTGIETALIIKGIARESNPDMIIVVDALSARSEKRLANTIQISTCGITPGSGIGNTRCEISTKSIGIPVISVGVPTVISSSILVADALTGIGMDEETATEIAGQSKDFFVMPKDCDIIVRHLSELISESIEKAFSI